MRKWIFVFSAILFFACEDERPIVYMQFSSDDLSHLYFCKDTLTNFGQDVNYTDSVFFLLNGSDTIRVAVFTKIHSAIDDMFFPSKQSDIYGTSEIRFNPNTGFEWAIINIMRDDERWNCGKYFDIGLAKSNYNNFGKNIDRKDTLISLDTALVLGRLYQDVYKLYGPNENNFSRLKTAYFAKKYGYIRIESIDGKRLELIKIKSKM